MEQAEGKLSALVDAGIALTSEFSVEALLARLVEVAAELTGARYAALGVIDRDGEGLERFVAHGLDAEQRAAIGDLPRGRGILGVLIREARPLRLHDIAEDARSVGFPPNHPPMKTFLGVPVLLRGVAFGNLYLAEKEGGADFTQDDEEIVSALAAQAAVAVENARLYEAATRWSRQLESVNEIAVSFAAESDLHVQLDLITRRSRELLGARLVAVALPQGDGSLRIAAAAGDDVEGIVLPAGSKTARALTRRRGERIDDVGADEEVLQPIAARLHARAQILVPLVVRDRPVGVVLVIDKEGDDPRFDDDDLRLAESLAGRAAVAVDLSQRVARDALRRVVAAQELERRRLARELHDETGQALTSILLGLAAVETARDEAELSEAIGSLRELAVSTLQDVRRLAVELRPKALDDFGLLPALKRLGQTVGEGSALDVQVEARLGAERLPPEAETSVYRIVQEALTNVVRHAEARHVSVVVTRKNASVSVVIEDDGKGFEPERAAEGGGVGLLGMRERVQLLDGTLSVESSPGAGTTLVLDLPVR
ncbi:MAG TPA: GAF domain-containing protein [Gaiellaceae bacterium]|nr:GAF domain-containing protein [Gaiellaceae bacterium]